MQTTPIQIALHDSTQQEKLDTLPTGPGVYQHKDKDGRVLYVGKAKNLRSRVRQYFQRSRSPGARIEQMLSKATDLEVILTDSEVEALILEANLIKKLKPRYNVSLKDDKSYPYIVITHEPFPRVFVTRSIRRDGSRYFGPYTDVKNVRAALKAVRDIFMIRSCNYFFDDESIAKRKVKVCLDYHIKKCGGPCEGLVSRERYGAMIDEVAAVLEGKTDALTRRLEGEMQELSAGLKFEEAAAIRDRIRGLRAYSEKQKVAGVEEVDRDIFAFAADGDDACGVVFKLREGKMVGRQHYYMSNVDQKEQAEVVEALLKHYYLEAEFVPPEIHLAVLPEDDAAVGQWLSGRRGSTVSLRIPEGAEDGTLVRLSQNNARFLLDELKLQRLKRAGGTSYPVQALQKDLRLNAPPRRIECFDISNIQGTDTVASMVVFVDGKPKKSEYRKFKVASVDGPDDFASMREVVQRRYRRLVEEQGSWPDLVIVDGGKGQLSSAVGVLAELGATRQPIIGLAKRLEEIFMPGEPEPLLLPKASASLQLLQRIRDEAHRFAITYHRTLRSKRTLRSELDLIEGIGETRARELLEAFGSVQGVKFATLEQLAEVVGEKTAQKTKEHFADTDDAGARESEPGPATGA
jgi:excinuclease ABC subunit C